MLGSLLAAVYSLSVILPVDAPDAARASLAGAEAGGPDALAMKAAATGAFDHAYRVIMYAVAAVLGVGSVVTGFLLQCYGPGSQSIQFSY